METKLYEASLNGDVQALNALLQHDQLLLDRLTLTGFNETPLHIATMRGHHNFAVFLLAKNPKLATALDSKRRTPVHIASAKGNILMVKELVRAGGCEVCCLRDQDGLTPVHMAAMNEHLEVVKELVRANRDAAKEGLESGESVLHMCVGYGCMESLKVLMELWSEDELARITDHGGNTLLHAAAINKQTQILNYLLQIPSIKANGNAINRHGLTALDVLDQCPSDLKSLETRQILMEAGVSRANDLRPALSTPPHSSTKPSQTKRKGLWARYVNNDHDWIEKQRGILIVAALVVAGMSFHSGINPPGGTITDTQNGRYSLGNAVQTEVDMDNWNKFVAFNSLTMITSLAIVVVLISGLPLRNKFLMWVITVGTLFAMVSMVATYLQSLAMMAPDMYVNVTSVWICLIWMLGCGVIALIHTIFFVVWVVMKLLKRGMQETASE
ncbi:putative ankyrin repeat-containing domain, PGG domain, ankyrin repeat-containing domain superfamily [Helianthus annuus]|nr:putative ankyrin repeat-containing domain, PGG domain, ankyrin repeat-containing domain superfamily [Helianthus annuus]KAJ0546328.1 putative ankyrin repeat-containing domain, PGG domain, ankyrin repeat-containing domain superfamily [Helianthus annuus]KAJ0553078.1 putative ankyrin repeat-containing domain, PGG domain, ankyrin repeat-containing domain superfamily [Helianthus annuus]KAJ0721996.1 putative ankyrin repeat-containing domain, PGG domain, ankyrin repeat-containing domain superfamily [